MATLLLAEHDNKALKDATNKALTAAKQMGGDVHVLVAGALRRRSRTRPPSSTASPRCCSRTRPPTSTRWPSRSPR